MVVFEEDEEWSIFGFGDILCNNAIILTLMQDPVWDTIIVDISRYVFISHDFLQLIIELSLDILVDEMNVGEQVLSFLIGSLQISKEATKSEIDRRMIFIHDVTQE